jgi:hypothetical protein
MSMLVIFLAYPTVSQTMFHWIGSIWPDAPTRSWSLARHTRRRRCLAAAGAVTLARPRMF